MRIIKHMVDEKEYEIRAIRTESGFEARTFFAEEQIGYRSYKISHETAHDIQPTLGHSGIDELIAQAKRDLDSGIVKS
jgi:hypothetical protein